MGAPRSNGVAAPSGVAACQGRGSPFAATFSAAEPLRPMLDLHAVHPASEPAARRRPEMRRLEEEMDSAAHALLERLERGVIRRDGTASARARKLRIRTDRRLDDGLATLRTLVRLG
ncbi:hypothetical protein [Sphingomonas pokkalii]|nr:hypothetical protein [Sphingomonas pokkalii]